MHRFLRHILLAALLHVSLMSFSQDDEFMTDTVYEVEPPPPVEKMSPFSSITQTGPVAVRTVPNEKVEDLKQDDAYWYANQAPEVKKEEKNQPMPSRKSWLDNAGLRNLIWIIILCSFIGIVIWFLASSNINIFRKEGKKITEDESEEELTDDIFAINYDKEIRNAEEEQNYRLAVRLRYLYTLKELADRNIIDYRHERTNSEYVNSLYGTNYFKNFFRLTRNFEYTWYGQFPLSPAAYEMMITDFSQFKSSLS